MDLHEKAIKVLRASRGFGALDDIVLNDLANALVFEHVRAPHDVELALQLHLGEIADVIGIAGQID